MAKAKKTKKQKFPARGKEPVRPVGLRVSVKSGDGQTDLGLGTYAGDVEVYFIQMPNGSLCSEANPERPPLPTSVPPGAKVVKSSKNPKIVLDSGKTVYGCQVWWEYVIPETVKLRVRLGLAEMERGVMPSDAVVREAIFRPFQLPQVVKNVEEAVMIGDEALVKAAGKKENTDAM